MLFKCLGVLLLMQFIAPSEAQFQGCDHSYNLNADSLAYLQSPMFPERYPSGTACRYRFVAPMDYEIYAECTISIDKNPSSCSTEFFYISQDGDKSLNGAEQFCGNGTVSRTSLFRYLVIAYVSNTTIEGVAGSFACNLTTRPQACDCGWSRSTRIVGGVNTALGEFPSMAALYHIPSQTVFCGCTIISHLGLLTATHCMRLYPNASEILVIVGDYNLASSTESPYAASYPLRGYIEYPGYNPTNNENDITLLVTSSYIDWSRGVGPACLPIQELNNTFDYTDVNIIGWGTTAFTGNRSDILQKADVNILPNSVCESVYPSLVDSQFCTYFPNRDACQYDSGGPVILKGNVRQYLLGIISYGLACGTNPGVNTRITSFVEWLQGYPIGTLCDKPLN